MFMDLKSDVLTLQNQCPKVNPSVSKISLPLQNNPCGAKESDRDASDRGKVIPVEQKSPIEMHPAGRNNP